jgi:hypothetical protein
VKLYFLSLLLFIGLINNAAGQTNPSDKDAQDYIDAANITSTNEQTALVKFVRALKYYGIWDNIHALYVPTGGTELSHKLNLKDPRDANDAYRLLYPNGAIHTSSGTDWNGINQGALTNYVPSSTRLHIMIYQDEDAPQPYIFSGDVNGVTDFYSYTWAAFYSDSYIGFSNIGGFNLQPESVTKGFFYGQRFSNDSLEGYVNGDRRASWSNPIFYFSNIDTSQKIWINKSTQNPDFLGTARYQVLSIGNEMNSASVKNYYLIVQAFLTDLGIQVGAPGSWPNVPTSFLSNTTANYRWVKATEHASDTAMDGVHLYSIGDSLYLWGGWNGTFFPYSFNSGYVSGDGGFHWNRIGQAPWNIRHSAGYGTDSKGYGYIVGSDLQPYATESDRKEVWRTKDGRNWELVTNNAPWSGNLSLQGLAIKDDTLYLAGGQFSYDLSAGLNDTIWRSSDGGATWAAINTNASHLGGILYNNFKYSKLLGKFVAYCGSKYDNDPANRTFGSQLWVSDDCINWTRLNDPPFSGRQYSDMIEWDNKLWIWAGDRASSSGNGSLNTRGLWYLDQNLQWHEIGSVPVPERHASGLAVDKKNNHLMIVCGNLHSDAWFLEKVPARPTFTFDTATTVYIGDSCSSIIPDLSKNVTIAGANGPITYSQVPAPGTSISVGHNQTLQVSLVATDSWGNSKTGSVLLTFIDSTPPSFTSTKQMNLDLSADCQFVVPDLTHDLVGKDNCGTVSFTQNPLPNTIITSGTTYNVLITANDGHGNSTTDSIKLIAQDTSKPVFEVTAKREVELDNGCHIVVPDIISGLSGHTRCEPVVFSQYPTPGTILGSTPGQIDTVILQATNNMGGNIVDTILLTAKDTIPPVVIPDNNIVVTTDPLSNTATVHINTAIATDNCEVSIIGTRNDGKPLNAPYPIGQTIITWTATDKAGNTTTAQQTVTVTDNESPTLSYPSTINLCYNTGNQYTLPNITVSDNAGVQNVQYSIIGATTRTGTGTDASGMLNQGENIIIWSVTDIDGNTSNLNSVITVDAPISVSISDVPAVGGDSTKNVFYIGYNTSIQLQTQVNGGNRPYAYKWSTGESTANISVSSSIPGTTTYSVTVTDNNGCNAITSKVINNIDVRCSDGSYVTVCVPENGLYNTKCVSPSQASTLLASGASLGLCRNNQYDIKVSVTPNPSASYFSIVVNSPKIKPITVEVYGQLGRLLESKIIPAGSNEVQIGRNLQPGIYLVRIIQDGASITKKIIKE